MDLDTVTGELYGLPPGSFVEVRTQRAAQAKADGDRQLSQEISALRKPSAAAWAVNLLVRERSEDVAALLDLGRRLREAQADLAGEQLRQLTTQRRQVVAALARHARAVAHSAGRPISEAVEEEVAATLLAALADPVAGDAVRAGRLTKALEYSGVGPVDARAVAQAVASPVAPTAGRRDEGTDRGRRTRAQDPGREKDQAPGQDRADHEHRRLQGQQEHDEQERRRLQEQERRRREAEAALIAARAELAGFEAEAEAATRAHDEATASQEQARRTIERLEAEVEAARGALAVARPAVAEADRARRAVERRAEAARRAVRRAEDAVAELS